MAFLLGVSRARFAQLVSYEAELQSVAGDVFNGGYLFQQLLQSIFLKPLEGIQLNLDQVGYIQYVG